MATRKLEPNPVPVYLSPEILGHMMSLHVLPASSECFEHNDEESVEENMYIVKIAMILRAAVYSNIFTSAGQTDVKVK